LTARLDRLGPARNVAQIGAVIGRDFTYPLLRAVTGIDEVPLQTALDRLAESDILLVRGLPPDASYRFKHALIADAAYENLLRSQRQVLHRRVAEVLRDNLVGTVAAPNQNCWRITSLKRVSSMRPSNGGTKQGNWPPGVRQ
jgi:predicted ATPase